MMKILSLPVGLREAIEIRIEQLKNSSPYSQDNARNPPAGEKQEYPTNEPTVANSIKRPRTILVFFGILLYLFSMSVPSRKDLTSHTQHSSPSHSQWNQAATTEDQYFHLLIPTTHKSMALCKTFLSGAVLDYPAPWTISWNPNIEQMTADRGGIAEKLENIRNFLSDFHGKRENDTLLILNNPDSWFQARPQVLLSRYHEALRLDHQRLIRKHGKRVLDAAHVKSRILFAADMACSPSLQAGGRGCYGVEAPDHQKRYLSPDFLMGKVSDIRNFYQEAASKAAILASGIQQVEWNEYTIFTDLLYEQESRRTARKISEHGGEEKADLGITLDMATARSLRYAANGDAPEAAAWQQDTAGKSHNEADLDQDIAKSAPPFWTVQKILPVRSWSEVSLLRNPRSKTIPALIQIGTDTTPADLARHWYSKLWFHRDARALLDNYVFSPVVPLALAEDADGGKVKRFWPTPLYWRRGNGMNEWRKVRDWQELCQEQDPVELFRDHKGVWKDPRP